ncbi:MAG: GNAT family N-acetyltransferase [Parvibaculum sp.]
MSARFAIEALSKAHQRKTFSCGNERIDRHFRETVTQDVKRRYATCFVARDLETGQIAGFYTLSSSNVPLTAVPESLAKRLPRYPTVPAVLIGWLGRDQSYAGFGLGEALLFDAIKTVIEAPIGAHAIFADAIDGKAAAFYAAFGFMALSDRPNTLYLPVATAERLLSGEAL